MKIMYGKKMYPEPVHHENDENNIWARLGTLNAAVRSSF